MHRAISTYLFVGQKLTPALLAEIEHAFLMAEKRGEGLAVVEPPGVEIFCNRSHFDYQSADVVREAAEWFRDHPLKLHALHAPTSRDASANRESGSPISVSEPERVRRLEAVDEIKRALEVAEAIPCRYLVLHMAGREGMDSRRMDAAFNSLEHLAIFAKQRGVTIALENTPGDLATPSNLRHFLEETKLRDLRLCFDIGHAHLGEGVARSWETMRELVVTCHLHDNSGEKDEHLLPWEGKINWDEALPMLADAPAAKSGLPLVMELKEPASPPNGADTPSALLQRAIALFDKLEEGVSKGRKASSG